VDAGLRVHSGGVPVDGRRAADAFGIIYPAMGIIVVLAGNIMQKNSGG
jgi:hypothetical protein